ncbi:MAG: hypothetical protein U1F35_03510 [Steroidobacteraceae bacterium]
MDANYDLVKAAAYHRVETRLKNRVPDRRHPRIGESNTTEFHPEQDQQGPTEPASPSRKLNQGIAALEVAGAAVRHERRRSARSFIGTRSTSADAAGADCDKSAEHQSTLCP